MLDCYSRESGSNPEHGAMSHSNTLVKKLIRVLENSLVKYKSDEYIVEFSVQGANRDEHFDDEDACSYWMGLGDYETIDQFEMDTEGPELTIFQMEELLKHLKEYKD